MKRFCFSILVVLVAAGLVAATGGASASFGAGQGGLGCGPGGFDDGPGQSGGGFGGFGGSRVVGQLYINDNTTPVNTVAGFCRHADGTLTPIHGSPFAIGGSGTGTGIASQGALQLSADGRYLLAVDGGSNQISVARIMPDGSLQPAAGGPVASNGANPVSIAVHGPLVYVANQGTGSSTGETNYTGFVLDPFGNLHPLPGSTVTLPDTDKPGDVLFNADGTKLIGTRIASSLIDSFTVGFFGHLTAAPGSPFSATGFVPAQGFGQLGSEFSPVNPDQLFVSDAHTSTGGPAGPPGLVSSFTDAPNGVLAPIAGSPFQNDGDASCWIEISHDGRYLFVVNTASQTISSYSIAFNGALTFLQSTPTGGAAPEDARLSPDGSTLWVVDAGADEVSGFSVNGGTLTPLPSSPTPLPTGANPAGIVAT